MKDVPHSEPVISSLPLNRFFRAKLGWGGKGFSYNSLLKGMSASLSPCTPRCPFSDLTPCQVDMPIVHCSRLQGWRRGESGRCLSIYPLLPSGGPSFCSLARSFLCSRMCSRATPKPAEWSPHHPFKAEKNGVIVSAFPRTSGCTPARRTADSAGQAQHGSWFSGKNTTVNQRLES